MTQSYLVYANQTEERQEQQKFVLLNKRKNPCFYFLLGEIFGSDTKEKLFETTKSIHFQLSFMNRAPIDRNNIQKSCLSWLEMKFTIETILNLARRQPNNKKLCLFMLFYVFNLPNWKRIHAHNVLGH